MKELHTFVAENFIQELNIKEHFKCNNNNIHLLTNLSNSKLVHGITKQDHHHNGDQAARRPYIIVFNMSSLIWGFGKSCTIFHGIISDPENMFSNVLN